ncbi:histidine triad (HIT) family protein [Alteromonadaceae bacterium Bs31]|nr:histidine triad (HIT) family protein [Alteromonadaceae bacterium Bs31]
MSEDSLFTKIINREIPADIVYEDDQCICIKDINPQAPTHVLVIPAKPIAKLADASDEDKALLGHLMLKVGEIARTLGVEDAFRVVVNNGAGAGQQVFHLHLHILANKSFDEGSLGMR